MYEWGYAMHRIPCDANLVNTILKTRLVLLLEISSFTVLSG